MKTDILPYLEISKQNVKEKISNLLNSGTASQMVKTAFNFHFEDKRSLAFQEYYCSTVSNRDAFLSGDNFFNVFKEKYALQGIDGHYLGRLEKAKADILQFIDKNEFANLYFKFFANASLRHGKIERRKNLGSFFAKLVHTFCADRFCALDNPIKNYFGLKSEGFYVAFIVISCAYKEWTVENPILIKQIRMELENHKIGKQFSSAMTDLKLLDLVFWYQANLVE